jgi:hypothetical protein
MFRCRDARGSIIAKSPGRRIAGRRVRPEKLQNGQKNSLVSIDHRSVVSYIWLCIQRGRSAPPTSLTGNGGEDDVAVRGNNGFRSPMRVKQKESIIMNSLILPRRRFILGAAALVAAPAIVRAASLMPVKVWQPETEPFDPALPGFLSDTLWSENPEEWCENEWRIAEAESKLPEYYRTEAGRLFLAVKASAERLPYTPESSVEAEKRVIRAAEAFGCPLELVRTT